MRCEEATTHWRGGEDQVRAAEVKRYGGYNLAIVGPVVMAACAVVTAIGVADRVLWHWRPAVEGEATRRLSRRPGSN
jgi:hypothetical protein